MNNFIAHPLQAIEDREQLKFKSDINNDNAVNVLSANIESLLEAILDALDVTVGEAHFNSTSNAITPGSLQTILTETVPALKQRGLSKISLSCRIEGECSVYVDGSLWGSMRTGAAEPNPIFCWAPRRVASPGQLIEVKFQSRSGAPLATIDCHLMAVDKNI